MKYRVKTSLALILLLVAASIVPVSAAEMFPVESDVERETIYYADGSYATVDTVIYHDSNLFQLKAATQTVTSHRTYTYYDGNDKKAWSFTVNGTFEYNRTRAIAKSSSSSYNTYVNGWKCVSRSTTKSGATVKGTAKFEYRGAASKTVTIGMKCSKTGTITAA